MKSRRPRLMIAAPASGDGKTMIAAGLLRALIARGRKPAAFKCGPDYIDPMFHREAAGVPGRNLDLFLAPPETVRGLFCAGSEDADISIMEGVMGYYDGVGRTTEAGAWHLAAETRTPVALAVRPGGAFLSLAATVRGFLQFRPESMIRGVVLNRCGEARFRKLKPMLEGETGLRVYGYVPDMPEAGVASRHLGLVVPDAVPEAGNRIRRLSEQMEESLDIPGLIALAESAPGLSAALPDARPLAGTPARIAVAGDAAFCFYYRENLDLLRAFGAELVFFSPIADEGLPEGIGGLYLGGGYPELHAGALADNTAMRTGVRSAVASGLPTLAEGGGFLYLQEAIEDADGRRHAMAGVLPGTGRNARRPGRFGYIRMRARRDTLLCGGGEEIRGHEFHYWDSENAGDAFTAEKASDGTTWECVVASGTLFAGFPHLYFWSDPGMAARFVAAASRHGG